MRALLLPLLTLLFIPGCTDGHPHSTFGILEEMADKYSLHIKHYIEDLEVTTSCMKTLEGHCLEYKTTFKRVEKSVTREEIK